MRGQHIDIPGLPQLADQPILLHLHRRPIEADLCRPDTGERVPARL
jgi:hypothetical protein